MSTREHSVLNALDISRKSGKVKMKRKTVHACMHAIVELTSGEIYATHERMRHIRTFVIYFFHT